MIVIEATTVASEVVASPGCVTEAATKIAAPETGTASTGSTVSTVDVAPKATKVGKTVTPATQRLSWRTELTRKLRAERLEMGRQLRLV